MNMLLHGVKDSEFEIFHGDTLRNDWDELREANPAKKKIFAAVVANPPFSYRREPTEAMGDDVRFKNYGLAPKSAADFAFLLHGFNYLRMLRSPQKTPSFPRRRESMRRWFGECTMDSRLRGNDGAGWPLVCFQRFRVRCRAA